MIFSLFDLFIEDLNSLSFLFKNWYFFSWRKHKICTKAGMVENYFHFKFAGSIGGGIYEILYN